MKKQFYRLFALSLAMVMLLGLAACGNKPATNDGGKEEITLNLWVTSIVSSKEMLGAEEDWWLSRAIKNFQKEYPYVKVEITKQNSGSEAATMFRAGSTNGTAPDIAEFWNGNWMTDLKDYAYPVDQLLTEEQMARINGWEGVSVGFNPDNERVGIPIFEQTLAGFYYNKDIIAEAGLDFEKNPPTTVDELFAAFDKIKAAGHTPLVVDEGTGHFLMYFIVPYWWVQQSGYEVMVKQNNGESKYVDDKGLIKALELYQELYKRGYLNEDAVSSSDAQSRFLSGEGALFIKYSSSAATIQEGLGDKAGFIKPCDVTTNGVMQGKLIGGAGNAFMVSKDTKYPEECAALIMHLTSAEEYAIYKADSRPGSIPNINDVKVEDLGELIPLNELMMGMVADSTFYVDNVVDSDVYSELIRYSVDLLVGKATPQEVAAAMDGIIAAK